MPFKLRPAEDKDCAAIARITLIALPWVSSRLFPERLRTDESKDDELAYRTARTLARLQAGMPAVVAVEVDESTGDELKVVGFSHWEKPRVSSGQAKDYGEVDRSVPYPSSMDLGALRGIVSVLHGQEERFLGEKRADTWICLLLAVDPAYHRRGLGKQVLRWGLDQAAAEGKRVFISSSPAGKYLYLSQGMKELGVDLVWGDEPHYAMMFDKGCPGFGAVQK